MKSAIFNRDTCWPSPEQEMLLKAALLKGKIAHEAWDEWKARVDMDRLDPGSRHILPLLWKNLIKQGESPDAPIMKQLQKSHRLTWGKNSMLFSTVTVLLRALHGAGFPTILLKGTALTLAYYRDYGLRPMGDFDILVPTSHVEQTIDFLHTIGFEPILNPTEFFTSKYRQVVHGHPFRNADGWIFDLHWHVLNECCRPDDDDDFWEASEMINLNGTQTALLSAADQLLHICVHGVRWEPVPPLRWVADAMVVLNHPGHSIDWDRLITQTEKRRLIVPMRATLNYLRNLLGAPVPSTVLKQLDDLPTSKLEHFEFNYKARAFPRVALGNLPGTWCRHCRMAGSVSLATKLWKFIPFLLQMSGVENLRQVPRYVILKGIPRAKKAAEFMKR